MANSYRGFIRIEDVRWSYPIAVYKKLRANIVNDFDGKYLAPLHTLRVSKDEVVRVAAELSRDAS